MIKRLCDFGCGQEAQYLFDNGKWCCSKHVNSCPSKRELMKKRMKVLHRDSKTHTLTRLAAEGKFKCKYCGDTAKFWIGKYKDEEIFCCENKSKKCPEHHIYLSKIRKQIYKDNPEYLEFQREHVKKIGKDKKVQTKKSDKMIRLHNADCDDCMKFRYNFLNAHRKRRTDGYFKNRYYGLSSSQNKKEDK